MEGFTSGTTRESTSQRAEHVRGQASEQARAVADTARQETHDVMEQVGTEVRQQVDHQKDRLAQGLRGLSDELSDVAQQRSGTLATVADDAAGRTRDASDWIEHHEPQDVIAAIEDFARRRPMAFLAGAAAAGVLVGRLTRGMTSGNGSHQGDRRPTQLPPSRTTAPGAAYGTTAVEGVGRDTPVTGGYPEAGSPYEPVRQEPAPTPTGMSDAEAARRRAGSETQEPM